MIGHLLNVVRDVLNKDFRIKAWIPLLGFVRDIGLYAYIISAFLAGRIDTGGFYLYAGSLMGFMLVAQQAMTDISAIHREGLRFSSYIRLLNSKQQASPPPAPQPRQGSTLQIQGLSFRYPGKEEDTLYDVTFTIQPGEKLALVGENGAGKSTLVSLLCRLYPPTAGSILLNGVDVQRIPLKDYRQVLAPTFQDYRLLPLSIEESLLGKKQQDISPQDKARVEDALKQVGVEDFVMASAKGIAAPLTRMLAEDGLVPSGGQDQKLALARAVCRQGTFVILDEPTAALDPRSEEEIFSRMLTLTRGQTSLFISHRLSSTRFADRIIVLDKGQVLQNGSHQQLMDTVGLYQEMYQTQAEAYQET